MNNMIGIIGALSEEVEQLINYIDDRKEREYLGITFYTGTIEKIPVTVCKSGVGKVYAAIAATTMINAFGATEIINTGVSGSLSKEIKIGNIVIANKVVQHDMDTSPIGDPVGMISGINKVYFEADEKINGLLIDILISEGYNYYIGTIATGDQFIASEQSKQRIVADFNAISCEMEGGAIAQVCYLAKVPFAVIRTISDNADEEGAKTDFQQFLKKSAYDNCYILREYIKRK